MFGLELRVSGLRLGIVSKGTASCYLSVYIFHSIQLKYCSRHDACVAMRLNWRIDDLQPISYCPLRDCVAVHTGWISVAERMMIGMLLLYVSG